MARRLFGGVDGGATKTWAVVGDEAGNLLGFGASGPANYHVVGMDFTMSSVSEALTTAAGMAVGGPGAPSAAGGPGAPSAADGSPAAASAILSRLSRSCFCLAADDSKEDHAALGEALGRTMPPGAAFDWDNDCWAALRGGTRRNWGAVVIGGSGTNSAAKAPDGRRAITRGIGRDVGVPGGASDITRDTMYWAFRMDEGFCPKTALHGEVLRALNLPDYDSVVRQAVEQGLAFNYLAMGIVTPLVFRLASEGDPKAQEILIDVGRQMGEQTGAVIRRAGIENLEVEVILAGSTYRGQSPLLIDSLTLAVHRFAPKARPHLPLYQPVIGAYLLALEGAGVPVGDETYANIERTMPGLLPEPGPVVVGLE